MIPAGYTEVDRAIDRYLVADRELRAWCPYPDPPRCQEAWRDAYFRLAQLLRRFGYRIRNQRQWGWDHGLGLIVNRTDDTPGANPYQPYAGVS